MHVNAGSFSNRPEQRSPPRCRLTELAGIENGLNRCRMASVTSRWIFRSSQCALAFMKLRPSLSKPVEEKIRALDDQRVVRHEFHVAQ